MILPLWYRRRRALQDVPPLAADTAEGARAYVTGVARNLGSDDSIIPFVAPMLSKSTVVAWMRYTTRSPNPQQRGNVTFERWHLRPFAVDTALGVIVVDASHVELIVPKISDSHTEELAVAEGHRIAVIGSVLRDGIEISEREQSFREARVVCKLVGNKEHPVVIAWLG